MLYCYVLAFLLVLSLSPELLNASVGDADPLYRNCVKQCEEIGCIGEKCFPNCKFSLDKGLNDHPPHMLESLYLQWKKGDCQNDCRYYCILQREKERELLNDDGPVQYHGKWPLRRIYGMQEPASVAFSAINMAMHFYGWKSFSSLLYTKLPLRFGKKPYYEYAGLWHLYGLLAVNSWFWSVVFHIRDFDLLEKLYYSFGVALVGYSLILTLIRSLNIKDEATRVLIMSPMTAFVITHIMFLNFIKLDYGWNSKVCISIVVIEVTIWAIWSCVSDNPSWWKILFVGSGSVLGKVLEIYDFPPYKGLFGAHALWYATTIPLTYLLWSFIKDDAEFLTAKRLNKSNKAK